MKITNNYNACNIVFFQHILLVIFLISVSVAISKILSTLAACTEDDCLLVLINSAIAALKINTAGVIPIIFAQSIILIPGTIATFFGQDATQSNFISLFAMDHWFSNTMFALLIIFFTYFYTALQFDPNQVSSNLKQQGGFIPGVKPGKKTAEFIENILTRVTLPGACFLGFIALMPYFLQQFAGLDYAYASFFGGTSLLIIVTFN